MPRIIDNQDLVLAPVLRETLEQAVAVDACVGYLNLRGWAQVADAVDDLPGIADRPQARVLVGMAARPEQLMRRAYRIRSEDEDDRITNKDAVRLRDEALAEFREQLVVGAPSDAQETALRHFRDQLAAGKISVRFFARYPLHAKLYLAHLADGQVIPHMGFVGSSNLTFSGLAGQGELNVDVTDHDATAKLAAWFETRWDDPLAIDVTEQLVEILDESWISPSGMRSGTS